MEEFKATSGKVECTRCGWIGDFTDCDSRYIPISNTEGDVEKLPVCPRCGCDDFKDIDTSSGAILVG